MHFLVDHLIGMPIFWYIWTAVGQETRVQWYVGTGMMVVVQTMIVIWISDVFWRAVDLNAVKVAKWVENSLMRRDL